MVYHKLAFKVLLMQTLPTPCDSFSLKITLFGLHDLIALCVSDIFQAIKLAVGMLSSAHGEYHSLVSLLYKLQ